VIDAAAHEDGGQKPPKGFYILIRVWGVLADLDPELHGLPLGIPAGVLGKQPLGRRFPPAILLKSAVK
jgi:hypothetical protein